MEKTVLGRFAPTPSGRLHLGNLFCCLLAYLSAKAAGGEMCLRVEDLDRDRSRQEYIRQMFADLAWLGITWEGEVVYQSRRDAFYESCLEKLEKQGLVYPCFCTRAQLHAATAPHGLDGEPIYPGTCRSLSREERLEKGKTRKPALRLQVKGETISFIDGHFGFYSQNLEKDCGDFILRRSDGIFAYQLAVVADDGDMGITQVVRGRDLLSSTPRQLYLYRLLGMEPPAFYHTPLLLSPEGKRLAKRDNALGVQALQDRGITGEQVTGFLACAAGLLEKPEPLSPAELVPFFSWDKVPREDVRLPKEILDIL